MRVVDRVEDGHIAVDSYRMEDRIPKLTMPVMLICGVNDWAAFPDLERWHRYLPNAPVIEVEGAGVPLPEEKPEVFAKHVIDFLTSDSVS
jgi:pimeloyl-ACP methyl ester carboxylesterase